MAYLEYEPTSTLFHYTSVKGFTDICRSGQIWFSDLKMTNDPREIHLGTDLVTAAFKIVRHEHFGGHRGFPVSLLAGKAAEYLSRGNILSASFSHHGDSLPMWSSYAEECTGVSIGFRPTAITSMPIRIQKVNYLVSTGVAGYVELIADLTRSIVKKYERSNEIDVLSDEWVSALVGVVSAITSAKHPSWSYENEIRGTHAAVPKDRDPEFYGVKIPASEYPDGQPYFTPMSSRVGRYGNTPFAPISFGKYSKGKHSHNKAIERVILGPKCAVDSDDVRRILNSFGYSSFNVSCSDCRIR